MVKALKLTNDGDFGSRKRPDISFWRDNPSDIFTINISVNGGEPQIINLEMVFLTYGERTYFKCPSCELVVSKLYLPEDSGEFKCRKCHGLQYFLTTFNKHSIAGRQFYKMDRLQKMAICRENMGRILYNGRYTKRFNRFLKLCSKSGFDEAVRSAQNLINLIKG